MIKPISGVTQIGACRLAPKGQAGESCTLNLSVSGAQLPANGIFGGPVLCQSNQAGSPDLNQCYQPSQGDTLNVTVGPPIAESVNWRTQGAVTPVKNQGNCNSSYAFSTTGAVEGFYAINTGTLLGFSEQQIIDCSMNAGCDGGSVPASLAYIIGYGGIDEQVQYPYTAQQGSCRAVAPGVNVNIHGFIQIPSKNEIALAEQVERQPVSAMLSIGPWFESYTGSDGVVNPDCSADTQYQNVLVVGYTPTYWIIKNSYGASWGNNGYLYLIRGINACGIANAAFAPN